MTNIPKGPFFVTKDYGDGCIEIQEASALSTALVAGSPQSTFYISAVPPYKNIDGPDLENAVGKELREAYEAIGTHFMAAHPVENGPGTYTACQFCGASGDTAFDIDHYDDCLVRKANKWLSENPESSEGIIMDELPMTPEEIERNAKDRELSQILTAMIHNVRTYGPGYITGELIDKIELAYQHLHDEEPT